MRKLWLKIKTGWVTNKRGRGERERERRRTPAVRPILGADPWAKRQCKRPNKIVGFLQDMPCGFGRLPIQIPMLAPP